MKRFKLGQRVRGGPVLHRTRAAGTRIWQNYAWQNHLGPQKPTVGVYIGYRHYQQGKVVFDGPEVDSGAHFEETAPRIKVALIVESEREKPVPVLYETLETV